MDSLATTTPQNSPVSESAYLKSNGLVAKFVFVIVVVILFVLLFRLGLWLIAWYNSPPRDPYVVKGMLDGSYTITIPQNPKSADAVPIFRSNNDDNGAAFTWSTWIFVNDFGDNNDKFYHIFSKGSAGLNDDTNIANVNNAPGVYLGKTGGAAPSAGVNNDGLTLRIVMNTVQLNDGKTTLDIDNIPIRKWFHLALRLENTILDAYINGAISGRLLLSNVPKQNYNDVLIHQNGGFSGKISDLRYFSQSLNIFQIQNIVNKGPNTTQSDLAAHDAGLGNYGYLGFDWYSEKY
tara:strand:- start:1572 stop:2447 length:876 start_codon:yes stop_codon:yes gene_type:complete